MIQLDWICCSSCIIYILTLNIFLCLHKGLFTFIVLIGATFIPTRQIQYIVTQSKKKKIKTCFILEVFLKLFLNRNLLLGSNKEHQKGYFQKIIILLYLFGLNKMEGLLTKNNWLRFPPKPKEAKLNGRRLILDPTNKILIQSFTI